LRNEPSVPGGRLIKFPEQEGLQTVLYHVRTGASAQSAFGRGGVAPSNAGNENQNVNPYAAPAENTAGQIVIRVTGQGAASGDVLLRGFVVEALN